MKTSTLKLIALLLVMLGSLMTFSCEKTNKTGDETVKLQGAKWKLVGIVEVQTGNIKILEPRDCKECYTLTFDTDSTFVTRSTTNELRGSYIVDHVTHSFQIIRFGGTKISEVGDGGLYVEPFWTKSTQSYSLQNEELRLYYSNGDTCLQFKNQDYD